MGNESSATLDREKTIQGHISNRGTRFMIVKLKIITYSTKQYFSIISETFRSVSWFISVMCNQTSDTLIVVFNMRLHLLLIMPLAETFPGISDKKDCTNAVLLVFVELHKPTKPTSRHNYRGRASFRVHTRLSSID